MCSRKMIHIALCIVWWLFIMSKYTVKQLKITVEHLLHKVNISWVTSGLYEKVIESGLENTPETYV